MLAGLAAWGGMALAGSGCAQDEAGWAQSRPGAAPAEARRSAPGPQGPERPGAAAPDRPTAARPPEPPRGERAPIPDRDLRAPDGAGGEGRPRVGLGFIQPRSTARGGTFEGDQFQRQREGLFEQPAPGATLRIPFSY
ncbi:hypothetical protein [Caldovatus aquaticus]|uniref:Translation initiation factor IF-2 n=1 Tax=Caldovatus aquaticus TaxID=2865671 RepID=A0ABS7F2R7_9PROT|nr:hypothetical protein [Caldovatus aquaticus]MBW8269864.1 hypothetical protein [Caldovatus aquaticus]